MEFNAALLQVAAVMLGSLISEDAATLAAAALAASGMLPASWAWSAAFTGIWVGDLGLYGLGVLAARGALRLPGLARHAGPERIARGRRWFRTQGPWALVFCRFIPGTRLPTYLAAGAMHYPLPRFARLTALLAALWISGIFLLVHLLGAAAGAAFDRFTHQAPSALAACLALVLGAAGLRWLFRRHRGHPALRRWREWEFWPPWLFYLPVAAHYARLALRHRSATLPSAANPGMRHGGLVGESKFATLDELQRKHPARTAATWLLPPAPPDARVRALARLIEAESLTFPLVLKPDTAQRGCGFKAARSMEEAVCHLDQVPDPLLVQRFIPGPHEAGIFYLRHPDQPAGRIFALTEKIFPHVVGDGVRTLGALVQADPRAVLLARTYAARLASVWETVPPAGARIRLVEAGNHAQGCVFRDGSRLHSPELEARIDEISRSLEGFYFGRYDVRYADEASLRRGEGFHILELNGASAEATGIYDATQTLGGAYAVLFEQWEHAFAIGAALRARGHRSSPALELARDWWQTARSCRRMPPAD